MAILQRADARGWAPAIGAAARAQSAGQVILDALEAIRRDERRKVAAAEALAIKDDPDDRDEIQAIHQDTATLRAR